MVGVGHHHVFGLPAAESAEIFAVTERALVDALVEPAFAAEAAVSTRSEEAGDDAVAGLESVDLFAHLFDHAHELVAEDGADVHRRMAVKDVEV